MKNLIVLMACFIFSMAFPVLTLAGKSDPSAHRHVTIDFENQRPGVLPDGWMVPTRNGEPAGNWKVVEEGKNKVLAQTSSSHWGSHFNVAVWNVEDFRDLELSVRFKAIKGNEDQGGGPIWRFQGPGNYYIVRANPLEDNFRVYKVVDGRRIQLQSARLRVEKGKWHTIKVVMKGDHIVCYINGRRYLDVHDKTFSNAGKTGVWTKADAVTYFDDLDIEELP